MPVYKWSKTAADNDDADSTITWTEGQAPSTVNNSSRAEMAAVAMWRDDISGTITTGGSSTAYTVTTNSVFSSAALMSGAMITFIPHTTSGAAPTLAVDGLTARAINAATGVAVATGALVAGTPYTVTYIHASTEFILHGKTATVVGTTGTFSAGVTATTGAFSSTLSATGNFAVNTDKFTVTAASGNTLVAGTLSVTGDVAVNTDKFTVAASSGNTAVGGTLAVTGAATLASIAGNAVATQADQETGTSTTTAVSPGRQHFHQSAAKLWLKCDHSGNLASPSYNITSVTDTGAGVVTVTIATDFSDADYAVNVTVGTAVGVCVPNTSQAVGSFVINAYNTGTGAAQDSILGYYAVAFGDFA
jgi:hypothetical protein